MSAVPSGSSTCLGLTAIVLAGTDSASSSPLRSKIEPRWARSGRSRVHCWAAALRRASPSNVCRAPTLTSTAERTSSITTSVVISRRRGCPAVKRDVSRAVRTRIVRRARWRGSGALIVRLVGRRGAEAGGARGRAEVAAVATVAWRAGRRRRRPARGAVDARRWCDRSPRRAADVAGAPGIAGSRWAAGAGADRPGGPPWRRPAVAARRFGACWRRRPASRRASTHSSTVSGLPAGRRLDPADLVQRVGRDDGAGRLVDRAGGGDDLGHPSAGRR